MSSISYGAEKNHTIAHGSSRPWKVIMVKTNCLQTLRKNNLSVWGRETKQGVWASAPETLAVIIPASILSKHNFNQSKYYLRSHHFFKSKTYQARIHSF